MKVWTYVEPVLVRKRYNKMYPAVAFEVPDDMLSRPILVLTDYVISGGVKFEREC